MNFLQPIGAIALMALTTTHAAFGNVTESDEKAARPNIIVILSDDMGYSDIGCYGGEIQTPVLDRLAENGLRFTQFYNTARCCPTRASLLSGLYPHQAGVGHMMEDSGVDGYRGELNRQCVTLAEALKPAGYGTYMAGKWHVTKQVKPDGDKSNWPRRRGFDRFYGTIHGAGSFYDPNSLTRENTQITPKNDPQYQPETFYYTDAISDNAVHFLKDHQESKPDQPFFMYVAYTAAHWPMHALPEDIAKYSGRYDEGYAAIRKERLAKMKRLGLLPHDTTLSPQAEDWEQVSDREWETRCMEVYAAMVDRMDQGIGKIVQRLEATNQLDNTLILFMQDNGGCAEGLGRRSKKGQEQRPSKPGQPMGIDELQVDMIPKKTRDGWPLIQGPKVMPGPPDTYIAYGRGWANVSNTPFREYKHWVHEGGIRTPLIAHWPAGIQRAGDLEATPGHLIDIMATCVDVAEADYPEQKDGVTIKPLEGKSLAPTFDGKPIERDAIYFEHEGNRAIRVGDWKLVAKSAEGPWELYNLAEDRIEVNDLAQKEPARVRVLAGKWQAYAERANVLPLTPYYRNRKSKQASSRESFELKQGDALEGGKVPNVKRRGFRIAVQIEEWGNGPLLAQGGDNHGYSLHRVADRVIFSVRRSGELSSTDVAADDLGKNFSVLLKPDGHVEWKVNGQIISEGKVSGTLLDVPVDGLQVGSDRAGRVGEYSEDATFQGTLRKVVLKLNKKTTQKAGSK